MKSVLKSDGLAVEHIASKHLMSKRCSNVNEKEQCSSDLTLVTKDGTA